MALILSNHSKRITPPHEPETWYEVRPIRAGDFEHLTTDGQQVTVSIDLLATLITAWSYPEPVTRENVACLDLDTFMWLGTEVQALSGIRDEATKKNSDSNSSPTSGPDGDDSPMSSGIS